MNVVPSLMVIVDIRHVHCMYIPQIPTSRKHHEYSLVVSNMLFNHRNGMMFPNAGYIFR